MFERALLRQYSFGGELDVGQLAETLLFYQHVDIIVGRGTLVTLVKSIGADNVRRLITEDYIKPYFFSDDFGVQTTRVEGIQIHLPVRMSLASDPDLKKASYSTEDLLYIAFVRNDFDVKTAHKYSREFSRLLHKERLNLSGKTIDVCAMVKEDFEDKSYTNFVARRFLIDQFPNFTPPDDCRFVLHQTHVGYVAETNINFRKVATSYGQDGLSSGLGSGHVIAEILEARAALAFASKHNAELVIGPLRASIIEKKFSLLALRRLQSSEDINLFQQIHLDGKNIRQVINSRQRPFSEFIDLLDHSRKFKDWLKNAEPETGLLSEYHKAVTKDQWFDHLPSKATRFVFMSGAGILLDTAITGGLATPIATALGAADTFLLDRLIRGWRPNHFVERDLTAFTNK